MDQRKPNKIDGSGIFFIISDKQKFYTILFMNIRKDGMSFQEPGGILTHDLDFRANASKELLEESCCSLIINSQYLNDQESLIAGGRYKCYLIHIEADSDIFSSQLINMYNENRKKISELYQDTKDRHLKCFMETNSVIVYDLNELFTKISSQKGKYSKVFVNYKGYPTEIHKRTYNVIKEYLNRKTYLSSKYNYQIKIITQQQVSYKKLFGKFYINFEQIQNIPNQLVENQQITESGVIIFIIDLKNLYVVLFLTNKESVDYLVETSGACKQDKIEFNALKNTFEQSCGTFLIHESAIFQQYSVTINNSYRSYFLAVKMQIELTQLQTIYFKNRNILENLYQDKQITDKSLQPQSTDLILVDVQLLQQQFHKDIHTIRLNNQQIPIHPRTITLLQQINQMNYFQGYQQQLSPQLKLSSQKITNQQSFELEGQLTFKIQ